jgi:hypothetical protein
VNQQRVIAASDFFNKIGRYDPFAKPSVYDRYLRISLKKPSSIPSDGEACDVSEKGWKGCLGDGSWAAALALYGQHFRKPIHRSQAGEAPEVLSGRRKEEFVLSSVWSSQTQTGQTKDSLEVRE